MLYYGATCGQIRPEGEVMSRKRFWGELKSSEFSGLDPNATVAVLPVAAIEQHGPHLPVMTDTAIMQGMIDTVLARLPDEPSHSRPKTCCAFGSKSEKRFIAPACANW